jgi:hypothetical protein
MQNVNVQLFLNNGCICTFEVMYLMKKLLILIHLLACTLLTGSQKRGWNIHGD